jgi:hypothetical protein
MAAAIARQGAAGYLGRGQLKPLHSLRNLGHFPTTLFGNVSIPKLLEHLSSDCPRRQATERGQLADVCGIHCPELTGLF